MNSKVIQVILVVVAVIVLFTISSQSQVPFGVEDATSLPQETNIAGQGSSTIVQTRCMDTDNPGGRVSLTDQAKTPGNIYRPIWNWVTGRDYCTGSRLTEYTCKNYDSRGVGTGSCTSTFQCSACYRQWNGNSGCNNPVLLSTNCPGGGNGGAQPTCEDKGNYVLDDGQRFYDQCQGTTHIRKYFCNSQDEAQLGASQYCGANHRCSGSRCIYVPPQEEGCNPLLHEGDEGSGCEW